MLVPLIGELDFAFNALFVIRHFALVSARSNIGSTLSKRHSRYKPRALSTMDRSSDDIAGHLAAFSRSLPTFVRKKYFLSI